MPLAVPVLLVLVVLPAVVVGILWLRIRIKEKRVDAFRRDIAKEMRDAGVEPLGEGYYRHGGRGGKVDVSTNPLFASGYTVRVAAWSDTIHDVELRRGKPVPPDFEKFKPLLAGTEGAPELHRED
jgi:hypothetical protein